MSDHETSTQWIQRCAGRLQRHHIVSADEAAELASELLACMGPDGCPERAADELLRIPMEV